MAGRPSLSVHIGEQSALESVALEGNPPERRPTFSHIHFGLFYLSIDGHIIRYAVQSFSPMLFNSHRPGYSKICSKRTTLSDMFSVAVLVT